DYSFPQTGTVGSGLSGQLAEGESLLAWFEPDLDHALHYAREFVAVTDRRLLARGGEAEAWRSWPLAPGLKLEHHDHGGAGVLELVDRSGRLACWRYTIAQHAALLRLIEAFDRALRAIRAGSRAQASLQPICPSCRTPLP